MPHAAKRNEQSVEAPVGTSAENKESFSNKPVVLADNGHGTRVKLWNNRTEDGRDFQSISIERSFKRKDSEEWETQKVSVNAEDLLAVARGLEKGHDAIVEKQATKQQGQARG